MKKIFVIIICICSFYSVHCQSNIGLRVNTEFSDNEKVNNAFGGGIYLNINDFSKKIEILLSFDFTKRKKDFPDSGMISSFHKLFFSASPLYILPVQEKIKIKIGPLLNYNSINATDQGLYLGWIETFKARYIGTGLLANIQFQQVFKLPLNFDIFISPTYLINIKYESDPTGTNSKYANNLQILNIQFGISYKIE